jgi:hypothetical protein
MTAAPRGRSLQKAVAMVPEDGCAPPRQWISVLGRTTTLPIAIAAILPRLRQPQQRELASAAPHIRQAGLLELRHGAAAHLAVTEPCLDQK